MRGKVISFNIKKGFGFIEALEGDMTGFKIFVHYLDVRSEDRPLKENDDVEFDTVDSVTGPQAKHVFKTRKEK